MTLNASLSGEYFKGEAAEAFMNTSALKDGSDDVYYGEVSERSKEHAWKVCIRQ